MGEQTYITTSPEDTWRLAGELLAQWPRGRRVLALQGNLGSGKTCFVQGLAMALGIRQPVVSPTFTIVREYPGPRPLYHIDLYRLSSPQEILAFGFEEYLNGDGITAIEWAERAGDLLPPDTLRLSFETTPDPDQRRITVA